MTEYEFAIVATSENLDETRFADNFIESCDDALVGVRRGFLILDFIREASSASEAIESAIRAVLKGGASVRRVEPDDLVSISEIAERSGLSRSAVSLYAKGERREGFPRPVVRISSESPMYSWCAVAGWLHKRGLVNDHVVELATAISQRNKLLGRDGEISFAKKTGLLQEHISSVSEDKFEQATRSVSPSTCQDKSLDLETLREWAKTLKYPDKKLKLG